MTNHCHHTVTNEDGIEDACGAEVITTRYDETWGHDYPVCAEHCPHLATVTRSLPVAWFASLDEEAWCLTKTRCVTCKEAVTLIETEETR